MRMTLNLPDATTERIDAARGAVNRNRWVLEAIERALESSRPGQQTVRVESNGALTPVDPVTQAPKTPRPAKKTAAPAAPKRKTDCQHPKVRHRFGVAVCADCGERA
jgi:hypothetical protein